MSHINDRLKQATFQEVLDEMSTQELLQAFKREVSLRLEHMFLEEEVKRKAEIIVRCI